MQPLELRWSVSADRAIWKSSGKELLVIQSNGTLLGRIRAESYILDAAIAPNGTRIAYATSLHGLFVSRPDGADPVQLEAGECTNLHWSSDSLRLLYILRLPSTHDPNKGEILFYSIRPDGTDRVKIHAQSYDTTQGIP